MARLNDPQPPGGESIDALKKRYIRQNREIARANSAQSIRIRVLESEASQLLEENINLREQVIKLTCKLDRRDCSRELLDNVTNTKLELEKKVTELLELVGGLSHIQSQQTRKKLVTGPKPAEDRVWRNQYLVAPEEDKLGIIKEDAVYPRKSLSMEDVPVLSPTIPYEEPRQKIDNEDDDTLPEPPFSSYLDMRPRRRRDSTFINSTTTDTSSALELPIRAKPLFPKPPKRKFEDASPVRRTSFGGDDEFSEAFAFNVTSTAGSEKSVTRNCEAAADEVLRRLSNETWSTVEEGNRRLSGGTSSSNEDKKETPTSSSEEIREPVEGTGSSRRRSSLAHIPRIFSPPADTEDLADPAIDFAPRPRKSSSTSATAPRKALGPKTSNAGFTCPQKQDINKQPSDPLLKFKSLDLSADHKPFSAQQPSIVGGAPPTIKNSFGMEPQTSTSEISGRPSRRSTQSINYALPALNTKLRRENVEPIKKSRPRKHSSSSSGSTTGARSRASSADVTDFDAPFIKREAGDEGDWNRLLKPSSTNDDQNNNNLLPPSSSTTSRDNSTTTSTSSRRRSTTYDVYEYPISSPEKRIRSSHHTEESEEDGEDEDLAARFSRKTVSFQGEPEEREKGRSSFGGAPRAVARGGGGR